MFKRRPWKCVEEDRRERMIRPLKLDLYDTLQIWKEWRRLRETQESGWFCRTAACWVKWWEVFGGDLSDARVFAKQLKVGGEIPWKVSFVSFLSFSFFGTVLVGEYSYFLGSTKPSSYFKSCPPCQQSYPIVMLKMQEASYIASYPLHPSLPGNNKFSLSWLTSENIASLCTSS